MSTPRVVATAAHLPTKARLHSDTRRVPISAISRSGPTTATSSSLPLTSAKTRVAKASAKGPASRASATVSRASANVSKPPNADRLSREPSTKIPGLSSKRKVCTSVAQLRSQHSVTGSLKRERYPPKLLARKSGSLLHSRKQSSTSATAANVQKASDASKPRFKNLTDHCQRSDDGSSSKGPEAQLRLRVAGQVRDRDGNEEVALLKMEIGKLKEQQKSRSETVLLEIQHLHEENKLLKEQLEALGYIPGQSSLSDNEKEFLLQKKCSSAPPSISGAPPMQAFMTSSKSEVMDVDGCEGMMGERYPSMDRALSDRGSLEWDKQSNSSISEVSVACLQDRIMQMEETHYSTSEELQATLQELSDLQDQLKEFQHDNDRLIEEKEELLESYYSKVHEVDECRAQIDNLKDLLLHHAQPSEDDLDVGGETKATLSATEREKKLCELLRSAQVERETMMMKQEELDELLMASKTEAIEAQKSLANTIDHAKLLESKIEIAVAEKRALEQQLSEMKDRMDNEHVELELMNALYESEKTKVTELHQARQVRDKSDLDELLDQTRKEKDRLEAKATSLQEQLSFSHIEAARLKDQILSLQEEALVAKNNAKKSVSDLEYKLQQVSEVKNELHNEVLDLRELVQELERKCKRYLEDKRDLRSTISELQGKLNEASGSGEKLQRQLDELRQQHKMEAEEWKQFQSDLLMTVRVANDFKTEAQQDVEKLGTLARQLQDRIFSLEAENDRLKVMKTTTSPTVLRRPLQPVGSTFDVSENIVLTPMDPEFVQLRQSRSSKSGTGVSVKSIIETIENSSKQPKGQNGSGNGVSSSRNSSTSPTSGRNDALAPILKRPESETYIKVPSPRPLSTDTAFILRDQMNQVNAGSVPTSRHLQRNSYTDGIGTKKSPPSSGCSNGVMGNKGGGVDKISSSPGNKGPQDLEQLTARSPVISSSSSPVSILSKLDLSKRPAYGDSNDKKDPLAALVKGGGSKRNALLKWCQNKTLGYKGIDITNFSSSWNDGLAFCALLHSYLPDLIPYDSLDSKNKKRNFSLAFQAAESVGISTHLNINDMISMERPDWQTIMAYVTSIYKHFET